MLAACAAVPVGSLRAQRQQQEFTQQGLLVAPFKSTEKKLGRGVANEIGERVAKAHSKRELDIIGHREISDALYRAGFSPEEIPDLSQVRALSRFLRADEYLLGFAERVPGGVRLSAQLILSRDVRMRQPLPDVVDRDGERAAARMAGAVTEARKQLAPQRRCENHLREGHYAPAIQAAAEGVRLYPRSTLARRCLLTAHVLSRSDADTVLAIALEMLRVDSGSFHAIEGAARAYDAFGQKQRAAEYWLRLASTDTNDIELGERVVNALLQGGNSVRAEPLAALLSNANPDHTPLRRLHWRVLFANKSWKEASRVGDVLVASDSESVADSTFVLRLATVYKSNAEPVKAVALAARGVMRFPGDARLVSLYLQLVRAESNDALTRGLAAFPQSADLQVMRSQELKARGKEQESVEAMQLALSLDSTIANGYVQLARAQAELGQLDSAYTSLRRALDLGQDSILVAQFALARGNALYQAANRTRARPDYLVALRFLSLADSVRNTPQAKLLVGAAAFSVAQSAATDAPKTKDCELSRLASDMLAVAEVNLAAGASVAEEAARQYLGYLHQLQPISAKQIEVFCKEDR